jgi:hypothetical protein
VEHSLFARRIQPFGSAILSFNKNPLDLRVGLLDFLVQPVDGRLNLTGGSRVIKINAQIQLLL